MIKIIPLIIFPFSFFLIFLGVKNLTNLGTNNVDKIEEKKELISSHVINNEDSSEKADFFSDSQSDEKSEMKPEFNDSVEPQKNKQIEEKLVSETTSEQKTSNINPVKYVFLQFGAFSKKKNASEAKITIERKIQSKFPKFLIDVEFDKKTKLYKLFYKSTENTNAQRIFKFCKEIKINCIFPKK